MTAISQLQAQGIPVPSDGPLDTKVVVYNAGQLRSLLDLGLDTEGRQAHYTALFGAASSGSETPAATDGDGGASLVDTITGHVFGNRELSAQDEAAIAPVFPLTMNVTAAAGPLTVQSEYDLSTADGSLRRVAFTDVTLLQGGYFVCRGTPLLFTCDTLTRTGDSGTNAADFNILGVTGTTPATPPTPGMAGQAAAGAPGQCSSAGIAGDGGGAGTRGNPGTRGGAGAAGNPGKSSQQATIQINKTLTATTLTVFTQSGAGGRGGDGGQGGPGQPGGNGGNGATCDCTGNGGGSGGDGGQGGDGGRAGNGGNGVDAAAGITIFVPTQKDVQKVTQTSAPAPPGASGQPGPGGAGGAGGTGGGGGKNNGGGGNGGTGAPGATGGQGVAGTVTGRSAQVTVRPL
jgi:hypothetical protein